MRTLLGLLSFTGFGMKVPHFTRSSCTNFPYIFYKFMHFCFSCSPYFYLELQHLQLRFTHFSFSNLAAYCITKNWFRSSFNVHVLLKLLYFHSLIALPIISSNINDCNNVQACMMAANQPSSTQPTQVQDEAVPVPPQKWVYITCIK